MLLFMCIPILFAIANVKGSENYDSVKRLVRDDYKYNHPPSFSVPVAVVYEDTNRQDKSLDTNVNTQNYTNDEDEKHITTTEGTVLTETTDSTELTTIKILKGQFSVVDNLDTYSKDEQKIPVAVIYDDEHKNINPMTPTKSKRRNRKQRNRKVVNTTQDVDTNITENVPSIEEKKASTTFTKRLEERDPIVPILKSENYVFSDSGDFHYSYEGGDGTKAFMRGELTTGDDDNVGAAVEGSFSYIGKDGNDYSLTYTADENGYRPIGAHLPTPPPIPPAIARALKYLATKTTPEPVTKSL